MLHVVDEHTLRRMRPCSGIYAFHLRPIRRATMGLTGKGPYTDEDLIGAREKYLIVLEQIIDLYRLAKFEGNIMERGAYEAHGVQLALEGNLEYTDYLYEIIRKVDPRDVVNFIRTTEVLATFLPPLYVGITLKQTIQERYAQHYNNFCTVKDGTFGGRLARTSFEWSDVAFSCAVQSSLRIKYSTLKVLETYIQYFTRPKLGRS